MLDWLKLAARFVHDRRMRVRLRGYRPVALCLIQSTDSDKYLFIQPSSKPHAWMAPQEGIEPDESIESASVRGIEAELGVRENKLQFRKSSWLGCRKIPEQMGERDVAYSPVKMRGKAYYAALIRMPESTNVDVNPAEIAAYEWLTIDQIRERLSTNSERKQQLIRDMFKALLQITV